MLRLEGFMEIQKLHHDGLSVSAIGRQLNMDRKTVRKYLGQAPRAYERKPKGWKIDPFRAYLRERGSWASRTPPVVQGASEAWLCRLHDAGEEGGAAVAERGPGAGLRSVRDRAGRTGPDGLGSFRQLRGQAAVRVRRARVVVISSLSGCETS